MKVLYNVMSLLKLLACQIIIYINHNKNIIFNNSNIDKITISYILIRIIKEENAFLL